ncbi:fibronectin type III domain-containing protein, partial [Haloparvum sedimenti]|uniref:fibronectin type III domain-containing protein n=1 Tax=Haloparvum sedimenti TaxID=1678448 RepID=UPI00071E9098
GTDLTGGLAVSTESYTDSGLPEGRTYHYTLRRDTGDTTADSTQTSITTSLPAPTDNTVDAERDSELDQSWTLQSVDEDGVRVYRRPTGGTWSEVADLGAGVESYTHTGVLNGQEYEIYAEAYTADASSDSTIATGTTTLPDEDAPVLGNGVEDEVAVDREAAVSNNGSVRIQIREAGASVWDSTAGGFGEFIGAFDTLTMEFVDKADGEEYEVRARTETDYRTGAWTDPVAITTKFPGATGLAATVVDATTVDLAWMDNADNEDGQKIVRERRGPDGNWWPEQIVDDAGANTESYTDTTAQPGREYRYRVRPYTAYTSSDSNTETATTPAVGLASQSVPSTGWHVEVETPSGDVLRPTLLGDPAWQPTTNGLPGIEVPVAGGDRWRDQTLWGQPCRVWIDGQRLPIDTLDGARVTPTGATLEASGGRHLSELVEGYQVDENETHAEAESFVTSNTPYAVDVDDPATDTRSDIVMLSAQESSIEDNLQSWDATTPLEVTQLDGVGMLQTGWFHEAEDADGSYTTRFADQDGGDGTEWSGGRCAQLDTAGERVEFSISSGYTIPDGDLVLDLLLATEGTAPAYEIRVDGTVVNSGGEGSLSTGSGRFGTGWFSFGASPVGGLDAGLHTVVFEATSTPSDGSIFVDVGFPNDSRFDYTFDGTPDSQAVLDGPEEFPPSQTVQTDDVASVEQVVGGAFEVTIDDTSGGQGLGISNDQGGTWVRASNTALVEGSFASGSQQLRGEITLSRYGEQDQSPRYGFKSQHVDELELRATLEDTPVLLDRLFEGDGDEVLNGMADSGDFTWELRRDPAAADDERDGLQVVWTQAGQRTQEAAFDHVDWEVRETIDGRYERVIVEGASRDEEGDTISAPPNDGSSFSTVQEAPVVPGTETVTDPDTGDEFEHGTDYRIRWEDGAVFNLGGLNSGSTYAVDYSWKYRGEQTIPDVSAEDARSVKRRVPSATSDRECRQLALAVLQQVDEPRLEVEATVVTDDPTRSLVAALSDPGMPVDGPLVIRDQTYRADEVAYRFESRRSISEVFEDREQRLDAIADRI